MARLEIPMSKEKPKAELDKELDEALDETFPGSDPIAVDRKDDEPVGKSQVEKEIARTPRWCSVTLPKKRRGDQVARQQRLESRSCFYGPGFGDGAGCVGLAFGEDGVVTGSVVVDEPVFVVSTVGLTRP